MKRTIAVARLIAIPALIVGSLVVPESPAVAQTAACNDEDTIFMRAYLSDQDGSKGTISERNHTLDNDCTTAAEFHATTHIRSASLEKAAEIGYVERWGSGGSHTYRVFWETFVGTAVVGGFDYGQAVSCCAAIDAKVVNEPGTTKWKFFFRYGAATDWTQIGPSNGSDAAFAQGIPMSETGKRGPLTGASDEHYNLQRKNCVTCDWMMWDNLYLSGSDTIQGWHVQEHSSTHYSVVRD